MLIELSLAKRAWEDDSVNVYICAPSFKCTAPAIAHYHSPPILYVK
jgi:hypothetical protein